jgi:hypothetical protein
VRLAHANKLADESEREREPWACIGRGTTVEYIMAAQHGILANTIRKNTQDAKGTAYRKFQHSFMKVFVLNQTNFIEEMRGLSEEADLGFTDEYSALRHNVSLLIDPYEMKTVPEYFLENKSLLDQFAQFLVEDKAVKAWNTAKGYLSHVKLFYENQFPALKKTIDAQYTAINIAMQKQFTAQNAAAGKPQTTHHVPTTAADNVDICRILLEMGNDDACAAQVRCCSEM